MKKISLNYKEIFALMQGKPVLSRVKEYYWDLDAEDWLPTGNTTDTIKIELEE